jgi:hypothetical protein
MTGEDRNVSHTVQSCSWLLHTLEAIRCENLKQFDLHNNLRFNSGSACNVTSRTGPCGGKFITCSFGLFSCVCFFGILAIVLPCVLFAENVRACGFACAVRCNCTYCNYWKRFQMWKACSITACLCVLNYLWMLLRIVGAGADCRAGIRTTQQVEYAN